MTADQLEWLARTAGLAFASVDGEELRTNEAARALIGDASSLEVAIARATGVAAGDPGLSALLKTAASDGRAARDLGRFRVILFEEEGTQRAIFVPEALEVAADVHRRAAATDLSAAVSHELSNVLGAILGWATLARRGAEVDPAVDRALSLIEKSARSAHATARHLLDTARGRTVVTGGVVDASALIAEVAEVLTPKAQQRNVEIVLSVADGIELRGNRADLFTVSWNLIQNAIEATPSGGRVAVSLESEGATATLEVSDEGDGIPSEIRSRVFEPYFTTKAEGTGLGLSLVRRAVESLEGTVALADQSRGACFVCRFPYQADVREAAAGGAPPRRQSGVREKVSPRGKRILVVDDDEAMRDLLATALGLAGAKVVTAASGTEALGLEGYFDLILVDLGLGDVRGDQVMAELRARGQAGATALVSGATLPPNLEAAPDSWLRKPFEIDDLLSSVEMLLATSTPEKDAQSG